MDQLTDRRVVIWEADGRPLPRTGYGTRLAQVLRATGADVTVVPYRLRALTATELSAPVHVLSGGETSAFSTDEATRRALDDLTDVLARSEAGQATTVGVCLGSQLIARAVNPTLRRSVPTRGMEAGLCRVDGPDGPRHVAEFHYEQIDPRFSATPGVRITHHNPHSEIQGYRWGENVLGYQFHPEWSPADLSTVLRRHRWLLTDRHTTPAAARSSVTERGPRWSAHTLEDLVLAPVASALGLHIPVAA
jgi:GMP synthase-like glutamine amidotransferase